MKSPPEAYRVPFLPAGAGAVLWVGWHFACLAFFQLLVMRRAAIALGERFGDFAFLNAAASFSLAFTLLGMHGTLMRYLSINASAGNRNRVLAILGRCFALRLLLLLVTAAGLWTYLHFRPEAPDRLTRGAVCLFAVLQGLLLLQHAALQGMRKYSLLALGSTFLFTGALTPARGVGSLFLTLSLGYLASLLVNTIGMATGLAKWPRTADTGGEDLSLAELVRFSGLLSLGALFVLAFDNSPILLLRGHYPPKLYACLALSFTLVLYPARLNALTEALLIPQMSAALHRPTGQNPLSLFDRWHDILHAGGILLVPVIIAAIGLLLRTFFSAELADARPYLSILMLGILARATIPVATGVFVGAGRPQLAMTLSAAKLAIDLLILLALRGHSPTLLTLALVTSWLLFAQVSHALARHHLEPGWRLDWRTAAAVGGGALLLCLPIGPTATAAAGLAALVYGLARVRRLLRGAS